MDTTRSPWATVQLNAASDTIKTHARTHKDPLQSSHYTSNTTINGDIFDFSKSAATCSALRVSLLRHSVDVAEDTFGHLIDDYVHGGSARVLCDNNGTVCMLSKDYRWLYRLRNGCREGSKVFISQRPYPRERMDPSITSFGTKLFLSGGWTRRGSNGIEHLNDVWELDVSSGTTLSWNLLRPILSSRAPPGRGGHSSVTNGEKIYIFGGVANNELRNDSWEFDIRERTWALLRCAGDVPTKRNYHQSVLVNDVMYVFGGWSFDRRPMRDLVALKISERQWLHIRDFVDPTLITARSPLMVTFGSKIYILSGWHPSQDTPELSTNDVHILDTRFAAHPVSGPLHPHPTSTTPFSAPSKLSVTTEDAPFVIMTKTSIKGGFGDLFRGIHRPSGCSLAMKRPTSGDQPDIIRRFRREGKIWSRFDHKNILPFLGMMERKDKLYIISPWMEQGDLLSLLGRRDEQTKPKGVFAVGVQPADPLIRALNECRIIFEIASGICYLHSNGYIHGDIKAQNVLLDNEGHALLGDFGLSKASGDATSSAVRGNGTLRWQAPELFGDMTKSAASDVYAFAMTIVEVLTGRVPFPGRCTAQLLGAVCLRAERPPKTPVSREGRDLRCLWNLASECWQQNPEDRPSMDDVVARFVNPSRAQPAPDPATIPDIVELFKHCRKVTLGPLPHFGREAVLSTNPPLWINWNSHCYPLDQDISYGSCWEGWNRLSASVLRALKSQS